MATSPRASISASKLPPGTGTSSTWCGCSCSSASTSGAAGARRSTPDNDGRALPTVRRSHAVRRTDCVRQKLPRLLARFLDIQCGRRARSVPDADRRHRHRDRRRDARAERVAALVGSCADLATVDVGAGDLGFARRQIETDRQRISQSGARGANQMKRLPLFPTLIVAAAVALMIALGIWQLQRARWKEGLLATYAANANLPPIALPNVPDAKNPPLFRRATGFCLEVTGWDAKAGRSAKGQAGWSHIARCRTGAEGPGLWVDAGWSHKAANPVWKGGEVEGRLAPDTKHIYRLVATNP